MRLFEETAFALKERSVASMLVHSWPTGDEKLERVGKEDSH